MEKKKLLIADDNRMIHELLAEHLGGEYELLHSFDGADTLIMAFEHKPDLVILDIMMPLLDGRAICKKLKAHPATRQIKVVMLSAKNAQSDRLVGFEVGADDYLEKPCSLEMLARSIRHQLA